MSLIERSSMERVEHVQALSATEGNLPSPINLDVSTAILIDLPPLQWKNYDSLPRKLKIKNTGHTAIIGGHWSDSKPALGGGVLSENYLFSQIHFHWGESDHGSEHTADAESFPLEMHLVHYKESCGTQNFAFNEPGGICVVVYFFKIVPDLNPDIQPIIESLIHVPTAEDSHLIEAQPISNFIYRFENDYLMYWGSVMTTNSSHCILWLVTRIPIGISRQQMSVFRTLKDAENIPLVNNFRLAKPTGGRSVFLVNGCRNKPPTVYRDIWVSGTVLASETSTVMSPPTTHMYSRHSSVTDISHGPHKNTVVPTTHMYSRHSSVTDISHGPHKNTVVPMSVSKVSQHPSVNEMIMRRYDTSESSSETSIELGKIRYESSAYSLEKLGDDNFYNITEQSDRRGMENKDSEVKDSQIMEYIRDAYTEYCSDASEMQNKAVIRSSKCGCQKKIESEPLYEWESMNTNVTVHQLDDIPNTSRSRQQTTGRKKQTNVSRMSKYDCTCCSRKRAVNYECICDDEEELEDIISIVEAGKLVKAALVEEEIVLKPAVKKVKSAGRIPQGLSVIPKIIGIYPSPAILITGPLMEDRIVVKDKAARVRSWYRNVVRTEEEITTETATDIEEPIFITPAHEIRAFPTLVPEGLPDSVTGASKQMNDDKVFYSIKLLSERQFLVEKSLEEMLRSALDIPGDRAQEKTVPPLVFSFSVPDTPDSFTLQNTGYTARVVMTKPNCNVSFTLQGGPLSSTYIFQEMTFRWESEHLLKSQRYPLEVRLLFMMIECETMMEACKTKCGLVCVSVFFKESESENAELASFIPYLSEVQRPYFSVSVPSSALKWIKGMIPTYNYYCFPGSCKVSGKQSEVITWIACPQAIPISKEQLKKFRNMEEGGHYIQKNYAALQPLRARPIFYVP